MRHLGPHALTYLLRRRFCLRRKDCSGTLGSYKSEIRSKPKEPLVASRGNLSTNLILRKQGFTVLFGITFGERNVNRRPERHAYNWYLDWNDLTKVVFFDPMTNTQSGTRQPACLILRFQDPISQRYPSQMMVGIMKVSMGPSSDRL
jgi:hypothetical protein